MNGMHHVCKKVVVGVFLVGSVDFSFVHAMAVASSKTAVTPAVQAQTVPLAIPAAATIEDTYTFSPQHESTLNYWVDAQHDDFAECRVVVDGVKRVFCPVKKSNEAPIKNDVSTQQNSVQDANAAVPHKGGVLARVKESVASWLLKKELAFGELLNKRQEQRERILAEQNKKLTVTADPSTLRTVVLTTGQVGIGAVAGYLLFRMGLSMAKSLEKKRRTRTITFDEE